MYGLSIAIKGEGPLLGMWPTHAMKRFPGATIYDQSPLVTAARQNEVKLGAQGHLNAEGQASAKRTAHNLANPPTVDATVTFSGRAQNGTVRVACKGGAEQVFQVRLSGLSNEAVSQAFAQVDAAITRCKISGKIA